MKVLWISDFPPDSSQYGGAEASMDMYGGYGKHRDHSSTYLGPGSQGKLPEIIDNFDCAIFYNTFFFDDDILEMVLDNVPYFNFECDFGFCEFRYPKCLEFTQTVGGAPCQTCPYVENPSKTRMVTRLEIMKRAKKNFFMSPLQYNAFVSCLPELSDLDTSFILPPYVDEKRFFSLKQKRSGFLYVGQFSEKKGAINALKYAVTHPGDLVRFAGFDGAGFIFPRNCKIMGKVASENMNTVYNTATAVFLLPEIIDTCPRVAFEALLAGCEIIPNKRVGTLSLDWPLNDPSLLRKKLREIPIMFWDTIEGLVK